jgi:uncharacterized protein YecE (DUF72 family)
LPAGGPRAYNGGVGSIRIGTSGWSYPSWRGLYYPRQLRAADWLAYYAARFDTVEINHSFYQLPKVESLLAWRATVPEGFTFAVKGSRFITHMKKLKDPELALKPFFERIVLLGDATGPILWQLPPRWRVDVPRFAHFLDVLPAGYRYTFEFRDPSWYDDRIYALLAARHHGFCIYDLAGHQSPILETSRLVYVRLHGPSHLKYHGSYGDEALAAWAERLVGWASQGRDVWCYFDNDTDAHAPHDAARLLALVRPSAAPASGRAGS